jgi:hypothetical protein
MDKSAFYQLDHSEGAEGSQDDLGQMRVHDEGRAGVGVFGGHREDF